MNLFGDIRLSFRTLVKNPGFTAVAVMTLAIGIGINAAVFTLTAAMLFKGYPNIARSDRIVYMQTRHTTDSYAGGTSYLDFQDWRAQAKSLDGLAAGGDGGVTLGDKTGPSENYYATQISANGFKLIGQRPLLGQDFAPSDDAPGAAPVAILSYGIWEQRYRKDPAIVGQSVRINGIATTVIGVMGPNYNFPFQLGDLHLFMPRVPAPEDLQNRELRRIPLVFGRLADGVSIQTARAEMETIGNRLASTYPPTNQGFVPVVQNFNEHYVGASQTRAYEFMWAAVGFVLLIACANLANLMLARAIGRTREISVRIALGAGRWRIIRQLLIESTILSAMGGASGWWIAKWGVRAYGLTQDSWFDFSMDYRVLGYLIAISIGTGFLFGLAPAKRLSKLDVNTILKDGGPGVTGGRRGSHLSALLMTAEMALAVVLLAGAGLMIRSFLNIYTVDVGVKNAKNVLTAGLWLPQAKYPRTETQISLYDNLKARLEAIPGVESVAIASALPTRGSLTFAYELSDAQSVDEQRLPTLSALLISPDYFRTLGAGVLFGREFKDADGTPGAQVAIVNQRFASQHWPDENPLGKRLRLFDGKKPEDWLTVVGVVSNIIQDPRRQEIDSLVYLPYRQKSIRSMNVIARTRVPPGDLGPDFRREIHAMAPDLVVTRLTLMPLADWLEDSYRSTGASTAVYLIFAAVGLLFASVGLYAVIAYSVRGRTQEIGIRIAMGAT